MGSRSSDERRAALAEGHLAEELVARCLEQRGWAVVARNWSAAGGELDVVACDRGKLRFVEVKARRDDDIDGLEAIDEGKRRRLVRAARAFLQQWPDPVEEAAFMVALVHLPEPPARPNAASVEWLDDAFDA